MSVGHMRSRASGSGDISPSSGRTSAPGSAHNHQAIPRGGMYSTSAGRAEPMYVAVKGGERAIANAHALLAKQGRGDTSLPRLDYAAVAGQLGVLVARVMTEGSLYDP